jgi:adenine phosphoribosyltransferase
MRQRLGDATRPHLLEQRRSAAAGSTARPVAARGELVLGAQQQPGAGAVEPVDPGQIDRHLPSLRHSRLCKPAVELGGGDDQPLAFGPQNRRAFFFRCEDCCGWRHAFSITGYTRRANPFQLREKPLCRNESHVPVERADAHGPQGPYPLDPRLPETGNPVLRHLDVAGASAGLAGDRRALAEAVRPQQPDLLVGIESRGFLVAAPLAYALGSGFAMVRKRGKLPGKTVRFTYDLEYGTDTIEIQEDAIAPGQRVIVVDDLIATGGTTEAAINLSPSRAAQWSAPPASSS